MIEHLVAAASGLTHPGVGTAALVHARHLLAAAHTGGAVVAQTSSTAAAHAGTAAAHASSAAAAHTSSAAAASGSAKASSASPFSPAQVAAAEKAAEAAYKAGIAAQAKAHPILTWIKSTWMGAWVRNSDWVFPALQSAHFLGMSLLIGVVFAIDLRVLGVAKAIPLAPLHKFLPLAFVGFGINLISGMFFFAHDPFEYAGNISFRIKMLLILLSGLNALWFRLGVFLDLEKWGPGIEASRLAKVISGLSLVIWIAVITAGRYIAFT